MGLNKAALIRRALSMQVLVIDDHRDSADMLAEMLTLFDDSWHVETAYDGLNGLERALGERFDALIVDLMLPGRSGLQVAREVRLKLGVEAPVLIALSGSVAELSAAGTQSLFDFSLAKPINVERLVAILNG
jgi:DNA-binding response OmpR family regulator